jgi:hypothetical protein
MSNTKQDPSAIVVPFGKYKGQTVAELLATDPQYADWLLAQGWLSQRFAELHAAIMSRGAGSDDTPEHNALQARFLSEDFRAAFLLAALGDTLMRKRANYIAYTKASQAETQDKIREMLGNHQKNLAGNRSYYILPVARPKGLSHHYYAGEPIDDAERALERALAEALTKATLAQQIDLDRVTRLFTKVWSFEQGGVDVVIGYEFSDSPDPVLHQRMDYTFMIELKPTMGDDFPTIIRQMKRLQVKHLLVGSYSGQAVPLPDLTQMFQINGMTLTMVREVEAELANARAMIAGAA